MLMAKDGVNSVGWDDSEVLAEWCRPHPGRAWFESYRREVGSDVHHVITDTDRDGHDGGQKPVKITDFTSI